MENKTIKFEPRTEKDNKQVLDIDRLLRAGNFPLLALFKMVNELPSKQFALGELIALSDKFTFQEVYDACYKDQEFLNPGLVQQIKIGLIRRKDCPKYMAAKITKEAFELEGQLPPS